MTEPQAGSVSEPAGADEENADVVARADAPSVAGEAAGATDGDEPGKAPAPAADSAVDDAAANAQQAPSNEVDAEAAGAESGAAGSQDAGGSPDEPIATVAAEHAEPALPVKPAGPKLTPISQLSSPKSAVQRGRASVAPAPFRTDEEIAQAAPPPVQASVPPPAPENPPATGPATPPPARAVVASATVPPPPAAPGSPLPPAGGPAPAAGPVRASASVPAGPMSPELRPGGPIPAEAAASVPMPTAPAAGDHPAAASAPSPAAAEPATDEKPKALLRPMSASAVSARARVTPPDPNDIPLEPEPPTEAELAEQAAREQAAHQQAMREQAAREQAAHQQAMREQAAREQAAREQEAREQAARSQAMREQHARNQPGPTPPSGPFNEYAPRVSAPVANNSAWSRVPPPSESVSTPAPAPQRRRATHIAMIAGLLVIVLLAGGFVAVRAWPGRDANAALAPIPSFAPPGTVLGALPGDAPMPSPAGVAAALRKPLRSKALGSHVSVQITDLSTGSVLFSQNQFSPTTPASSMKLATCLSLLELRGPYYRLTTHAVAGRKPGEVVLVGAGDPTLAAKQEGTYPGSGSLVDLANQVKAALGGVKPTKVIIDTSLFTGPTIGPGWEESDVHSSYATSIYALTTDGGRVNPADHGSAKRYDDPAAAAGAIFAKYLGLPSTAVAEGEAPPAPATDDDPTAPGAVLGSVRSAPLVRIIETMLAESDNMLAEFMARQVAIAMNEPASFAGAARAVTEELTKLGMPMQGVRIVDGSGLSPKDKLTPALLSAILVFAAKPANPKAHTLFTGMPVAGWSGTLSHRFKKSDTTAGQGLIRAKTGTLTGVSALAGTMIDSSGRALVFVLLVDKVPWSANVLPAIDRVGAAVWQCGCG